MNASTPRSRRGWVAFVGPPDPDALARFMRPLDFEFHLMEMEPDYGSLEEAIATWGCIYGEVEIDRSLEGQTAQIEESLGIWYRRT